jgi:hypothetical protein
MSIVVPLEDLAGEIAERGAGYLLSAAGGRPHILHLNFVVDGIELRAEVGPSAKANIEAQPAVAVLWPGRTADEYSLIADGEATIDGEATVVVTAVGAMLHRPAP